MWNINMENIEKDMSIRDLQAELKSLKIEIKNLKLRLLFCDVQLLNFINAQVETWQKQKKLFIGDIKENLGEWEDLNCVMHKDVAYVVQLSEFIKSMVKEGIIKTPLVEDEWRKL